MDDIRDVSSSGESWIVLAYEEIQVEWDDFDNLILFIWKNKKYTLCITNNRI